MRPHFEQGVLEEVRSFIRTALRQPQDASGPLPLVVYHGDGDGCGAAYFMRRFMNRPAAFHWIPTPEFDFVWASRMLGRREAPVFVFVDLPVHERPQLIRNLAERSPVLVYDHHFTRSANPWEGLDRVLYLNPVVHQRGEEFPASLFGYELLEQRRPMDDEVLFMALHTENWLGRISHYLVPEARQPWFKELAELIHGSFLLQNGGTSHYALRFLERAEALGGLDHPALKDVKEFEILQNIQGLIRNEKIWLMQHLREQLPTRKPLSYLIKPIESSFRLAGIVASSLRQNYPDVVVGIWQRWKNRFHCELRRGDRCRKDLALLVEELGRQIPLSSGGGHPAAAAFTARARPFFEALRILKATLRESSPP